MKYSKSYLAKLEDLFSESDYVLRYEKGNFQSGFCVIKETKVAIVNKFFPLDGKINCLHEILNSIQLDTGKMSPKNLTLLQTIQTNQLEI